MRRCPLAPYVPCHQTEGRLSKRLHLPARHETAHALAAEPLFAIDNEFTTQEDLLDPAAQGATFDQGLVAIAVQLVGTYGLGRVRVE